MAAARINGAGCEKIHFNRIIKPHTDLSLGDCSYLDTCRHMDKCGGPSPRPGPANPSPRPPTPSPTPDLEELGRCKFIHYEVDPRDAQKMRDGDGALDPHARTATNQLGDYSRHYESQFINCDIRTFPMPTLGKFTVIMADPPWDIHMELPYGMMSDDEMRKMDVQARAAQI